jgi:hypothetical protein
MIPHVLAAAARRMQRILKQHIWRSQLVDDLGVPRIGPESFEPAADNCFVFGFARHVIDPLML